MKTIIYELISDLIIESINNNTLRNFRIFNVSVVFYGYGVLLFLPHYCNIVLTANVVLQYLFMFCLPQVRRLGGVRGRLLIM